MVTEHSRAPAALQPVGSSQIRDQSCVLHWQAVLHHGATGRPSEEILMLSPFSISETLSGSKRLAMDILEASRMEVPTQTPTQCTVIPPPRDGLLKSLGLYPSIISMHNHIYLYFPNTFLFKLLLTCPFHLRSGEQISEAFLFGHTMQCAGPCSLTRDQAVPPALAVWSLNRWTGEVPVSAL